MGLRIFFIGQEFKVGFKAVNIGKAKADESDSQQVLDFFLEILQGDQRFIPLNLFVLLIDLFYEPCLVFNSIGVGVGGILENA